MVREFVFNEGCVVIDNVRLPIDVARALSNYGCSFTGWTALAIHAGSKLLILYHPNYLEIACPDIEAVVSGLRRLELVIWRGRRWATVGWVYRPLRVALGELRIFSEEVSSEGERCGLGVASIIDAARHIMRFRERVRDLRLVERYSNGRVRIPTGLMTAKHHF
ncbi:hypothetical protein [Vulcanisaeta distributa]|uniref:Uncharacterized protein n=1 Tax=Vulcanisaeta distributa (strain DSM 14429 / JCM 11212 / NBRC 100878 / IC-017) TaxID=572478 RepID=E1QRH7_VULDI|nr:hypothetical protein [Vulcanisaeta distributa]ADN51791.1 conserved hypothetical protein [Vulcanisaeta distributa DSM 14429]